ncbi:MAG: hypothetical protein WD225_12395 [Ilumatobacteraceae bacterium]
MIPVDRRLHVRDRGASDALALVLLAPAMLGLALLVVFLGRQVDARAQVRTAAESAAQAAALARDPAAAEQAAVATVEAMLVDADTCEAPSVTIDLSAFAPGGTVAVTVECGVARRGLEPLPTPTVRSSATATATVDPFRSIEGAP